MIKDLNLMEGQEDLRIVEHLDMHKLPESGARHHPDGNACGCKRVRT